MEHRWGDRHSLDEGMLAVRAGGWSVLARVRNISLSGAYLQCAFPDVNAASIQVFFNESEGPARVAAHIVRRTTDGIGIEWEEFAPVSVVRILTRVERERAVQTQIPTAAHSPLPAALEGA